MPHVFVTRCIEANGDDINEMVDLGLRTEMSNGHFIRKVAPKLGIDEHVMHCLGYDSKEFFANEFAMNCNRSFYQGIPCVYVQHSRIEHVYVDAKDAHKVLSGSDSHKRQIRISLLRNGFEEMLEDRQPASAKDYMALAKAFYLEHKKDLDSYRIPLSAFALYQCDHRDVFARYDKANFGKDLDSSLQPGH